MWASEVLGNGSIGVLEIPHCYVEYSKSIVVIKVITLLVHSRPTLIYVFDTSTDHNTSFIFLSQNFQTGPDPYKPPEPCSPRRACNSKLSIRLKSRLAVF